MAAFREADLALAAAAAVAWVCWNFPEFWRDTEFAWRAEPFGLTRGAEGEMRAAIFDDPAKVRMITIRNAAFDDSQILLLKGYTGLWWLDLRTRKSVLWVSGISIAAGCAA